MKYWVSCEKFTVLVETNESGIITQAAPIVQRFLGQPIMNLFKWIGKNWPEDFEFKVIGE